MTTVSSVIEISKLDGHLSIPQRTRRAPGSLTLALPWKREEAANRRRAPRLPFEPEKKSSINFFSWLVGPYSLSLEGGGESRHQNRAGRGGGDYLVQFQFPPSRIVKLTVERILELFLTDFPILRPTFSSLETNWKMI